MWPFTKKKVEKKEDKPIFKDWTTKDVVINGVNSPFKNHFYVNIDHNLCVVPQSEIFDHPMFKDIVYNNIRIGSKSGQNKTVKDALKLSREIKDLYFYGKMDDKTVESVIRNANDFIEGIESLKNKYGQHAILFNNDFVENTIYITSCPDIGIEIKPYQIDDYIKLLSDNGYTQYLTEYRKMIIENIAYASRSTVGGVVLNRAIQFDQPSVRISLYIDWKICHEEELERKKKNKEYKAIIDEITQAREKIAAKDKKKEK